MVFASTEHRRTVSRFTQEGLSTKKVTEIRVQAGGDPETTPLCLEVIAREKDRKQGPYKDTRHQHS